MHQGKGEVFKVVEHMPRFPGCEDLTSKEERKKCADKKMLEFIYQHIQYPPEAIENKVEGIAVIEFIVEKNGSIEEMEIARDPGYGLGQEALRVVGLMAKEHRWTPGPSRGRPVRVQIALPVTFRLPEQGE
jgi:periplasmic protein TonB